jgi:hypothetical protein
MCAQAERPSTPQCRRLFKRLFMYARCKFSSKKNFIFKFLSLSLAIGPIGLTGQHCAPAAEQCSVGVWEFSDAIYILYVTSMA